MAGLLSGQIVLYAGYALVGIATFLATKMLVQEQEARAAEENLDELRNRKASSSLVKLTRPFFGQYVVPTVRGKKFWDKMRLKYRRKLITAKMNDEFTPDEFISFKLFLIVFFPIVGGLLNALDLIDLEWYYILGSAVGGWFYPDFWINEKIKVRQKEMLKTMPFIVDLMALSMEAGLDFVGAVGKMVEKARMSPLVEEFEQMLKEIRVGSSRAEALRELSLRADLPELRSLVAILISADQMGAPIGKVLRQQSDQIRSGRFLRAEKAGAAAASKLMLPIVLIILPAVLLMVAGPFVISMLN